MPVSQRWVFRSTLWRPECRATSIVRRFAGDAGQEAAIDAHVPFPVTARREAAVALDRYQRAQEQIHEPAPDTVDPAVAARAYAAYATRMANLFRRWIASGRECFHRLDCSRNALPNRLHDVKPSPLASQRRECTRPDRPGGPVSATIENGPRAVSLRASITLTALRRRLLPVGQMHPPSRRVLRSAVLAAWHGGRP